MVPVTVHAGVVSVIEWVHDAVFDQGSDAVFTEFVAERSRVVTVISRETPQVAGVAPGDLRADLRIVFLRGSRVNVGDVQRFDINESRDFQRSNAIMRAVGVVTAGLITVKAVRINRSVASAFLDRGVEKRTPRLRRDSLEPSAQHRVVWKPCEADLIKDSGHLAEQIHRDAVGFAQLETKCMKREHRPFSEPAIPFGVGKFVWVLGNLFTLGDRNTREETDFECHTNLPLRFLRQ